MKFGTLFAVFAALSLFSQSQAQSYRMLIENIEDREAGDEIFGVSFNTFDDVMNSNASSSGFTQIGIGPNFTTTGLAYDGQYRLLIENIEDREAGNEIFVVTFDTFEDLMNSNASSSGFTQIGIGPSFTTTGLTYDGQFRLMIENNEDREAGDEIFMVTFDTFDDLMNSNASSSGFTQIGIGPNFNTTGLDFDGQYRLMIENIEDREAGNEIFMVTFDTFDDLMNSNADSSGFTQIGIGPNFNTTGFAYEPVPEPATLTLLGVGALLLNRRRKKSK